MHKSREPRVSCLNPGKPSRDLLQHVSRPDSPTMAREQGRAPPRHSHGGPTSLAPHERLTDLAVVPREKPHTGPAVSRGLIRKEAVPNQIPTGMQGYVYNTRRPVFRDPRVRQALGYLFD